MKPFLMLNSGGIAFPQLETNPEHQHHADNRGQEVRADLRIFRTHDRTISQDAQQETAGRQFWHAIRHWLVQVTLMQAIYRQHQSNQREG